MTNESSDAMREIQNEIEKTIDALIALLPPEDQIKIIRKEADRREKAKIEARTLQAREEALRKERDAIEAEAERRRLQQIEEWRKLVAEIEQLLASVPEEHKTKQTRLLLDRMMEGIFETWQAILCVRHEPMSLDTDPLTGLYSTRFLHKVLTNEIAYAERHQLPLTMLMLDINRFKRVNDTYGHIVGDKIVVELAAILRSSVRLEEFVFRTGGAEFIVLLPGTNLAGGIQLGEKIQRSVETSDFLPDNVVGKITVTVAVCEYEAGEGEARFMMRADEAMFRAKRGDDDEIGVPVLI